VKKPRRRSRPQGPTSLARAGEGVEASAKEAGSIAEGACVGLNYERNDVSHHHRADSSRLRFLADVSKVQGEPREGAEEARGVSPDVTVAPENLEMSERMRSSWSGQAVFVIAALIWLIPDRRIEKRLVI